MEAERRFDRALEVPDGIVASENRLTAAALNVITKWDVGENHSVADMETVEECVRVLRTKYAAGDLDRLLLGLESDTTLLATRIEDEVRTALTENSSRRFIHPPAAIVENTVGNVLTALRTYIEKHPVDSD